MSNGNGHTWYSLAPLVTAACAAFGLLVGWFGRVMKDAAFRQRVASHIEETEPLIPIFHDLRLAVRENQVQIETLIKLSEATNHKLDALMTRLLDRR